MNKETADRVASSARFLKFVLSDGPQKFDDVFNSAEAIGYTDEEISLAFESCEYDGDLADPYCSLEVLRIPNGTPYCIYRDRKFEELGKRLLSSIRRKYLRPIPKNLRFAVLKRDNYRCRLCGTAASDSEDVRLEVDHIIPRSKGGTNELENLHTTCFDCNRGKWTREL